MSGRDGSISNGFSIFRRTISRPSHIRTSVANGSFRSSAVRNFFRDPGFRTTNVPAAPTFTTSYSLNCRARRLGRKVLCPPTLTPRRKTIRATGSPLRAWSWLQSWRLPEQHCESAHGVPTLSCTACPYLTSFPKIRPNSDLAWAACRGSTALPTWRFQNDVSLEASSASPKSRFLP